MLIRQSVDEDFEAMLAVVNTAAGAYRGVIPADRWHDPYMSDEELKNEIASLQTTQRSGVGTTLLRHIEHLVDKPILIGTWAAASWAIEFYRRNGFTLVTQDEKDHLLKEYWSIPARQIETSVVLADRRWIESRRREPA